MSVFTGSVQKGSPFKVYNSHKPHTPNNTKRGQRYKRVDRNSVKHRSQPRFFKVDNARSETDSRKCRNHQEFTCGFYRYR